MERTPSVVLWRESRWHCECRRVSSSQWAANLYADDIIIAECVCDRFTLMLHTAQQWQMAVTNGHPATQVVDFVSVVADQRLKEQLFALLILRKIAVRGATGGRRSGHHAEFPPITGIASSGKRARPCE